ncbi:acyl-CoA dehydrogenase family protein [Ferruginibacter sp.]
MMFHPSAQIDVQLVTAIRNVAGEAETLQTLHPVQLAILYEQQWLQLFVPQVYNGLQLDLVKALQLEEALAWTDGSVGWTVTLCAGAAWFAGFLQPGIATMIFGEKNVCIAGSGKASGIAKKEGENYIITGGWDYASGADHATAFTANCIIEENGSVVKNSDGQPLIRPFIFLRNEVTVHQNWQRIGMIATGSHSFSVKELTVNSNRAFIIDPAHAVSVLPIYQYPFLQFAEATLAVNSSGMALRFLELCSGILQPGGNTQQLYLLETCSNKLNELRTVFYKAVDISWGACIANGNISKELLQQVSDTSKQLAIYSRRSVDELYPYCGMQAADPATEISRVWRNLHTASQHSLFNR